MNIHTEMNEMAEAICRSCGVEEIGTISRLTLTLDWRDGSPTLELERPLVSNDIEGKGQKLQNLLNATQFVVVTETFGVTHQTEYTLEERVGDCWRRRTFPTLKDMLEATEGGRSHETDGTVTQADRPYAD